MPPKIAAGNWKMNGTQSALDELDTLAGILPKDGVEVVICPPATLLVPAAARGSAIAIGAQDCHAAEKGAHTGDISAAMVADTGAAYVILGHSERRDAHGETDADVNAKMHAAWAAGLTAILCLGESEADRDAGRTLDVVGAQLAGSLPQGATPDNTVLAYEPIWAIGTGKVPTQEQIVDVHDFLRAQLVDRLGAQSGNAIALLYGGSVKGDNAATIFEAQNVNGALVGGASLKAADFAPIVSALAAS
ncbi:Triosephosphate isomerase [Sulfitobacter sp. THAF37]|uniref:triose-phosphate isomerase n=1 Tax=Sulfitobacter sp. THAF37 TaxID=2587855 RepID=UPI0012683492|nr:triose-phosphate isomerase [Sulfitobacter sp. THAF37]QFT60185.1 Triosephosphate isomerase [Sulfitobacter sp. THAF37]